MSRRSRSVRRFELKGKKSKEEKKAAKLSIAAKAIRDPNDYEDKALRFQRMVVTDAYSISVLLTTATDKRGRVFGARKTRTALPTLDPDTAPSFQHLLDKKRYTPVGLDPGKKDPLWMTDGEKTLRYTNARRDRECRFRQVRLATEDKKRNWFCNGLVLPVAPTGQWRLRRHDLDPGTNERFEGSPSIEDVETKFLCSVTSKSCKLDRFEAYLAARERVQVHLKAFYSQTFFRSSKYSVYLAKKSSEDKLVDRIRNTFAEKGKALVIFWGNWGRRPKASRPTRLPNRLRNGCAAMRHLAAKPQDLDAGHRPPALHPPPPLRRHPQRHHLLRHHLDRVRGLHLQRLQRLWRSSQERGRRQRGAEAPGPAVPGSTVQQEVATGQPREPQHLDAGHALAPPRQLPPLAAPNRERVKAIL